MCLERHGTRCAGRRTEMEGSDMQLIGCWKTQPDGDTAGAGGVPCATV